MKLLLTTDNVIVHYCDGYIAFGQWEEADRLPNGTIVWKWKFEDSTGKLQGYAIDENQQSAYGTSEPVCKVVEVDDFPTDFEYGKYIYKDGAVVLNPDYVEPPLPTEERVENLETEVADLTEAQADTLYELSLMQLGL